MISLIIRGTDDAGSPPTSGGQPNATRNKPAEFYPYSIRNIRKYRAILHFEPHSLMFSGVIADTRSAWHRACAQSYTAI